MKKLLLILVYLPMIGFGQPYLNQTSIWLVSDATVPPGPMETNDYQYYIDGDTLIGPYTYYKIYMQGFHTDMISGLITPISGGPVYLREDGPQWHVYNQNTAIDELLCDFSLNIGDNIGSFTAPNGPPSSEVIINITNIILFGTTTRKKFHLFNGKSFIEGVGNLAGLFSDYRIAIEYGSVLNCYIQDNINWGLSPDSSCNLIITSIQEQTTKKELLKVTDLLGREKKQTNQLLFYIYDDGTVEKRMTIE